MRKYIKNIDTNTVTYTHKSEQKSTMTQTQTQQLLKYNAIHGMIVNVRCYKIKFSFYFHKKSNISKQERKLTIKHNNLFQKKATHIVT